ncbi:MAG: DUF5060 domain-containing protein, partial [Pirellulales bacterium]|nr:DUF5060 domain-containing protein [Pirellulales bacterium]
DTRAFHLVAPDHLPKVKPDGDPAHLVGASGGAYLEILPDTRRTHGDKLVKGTNFSPEPGKMAVLHYRVNFSNPGRYYVWVRAYSTGTEDNGLHVGIDDTWPASGQRLQWCKGKNSWRWESKQRTEKEHCGEPYKIFLDVDQPGVHKISFSMREDGFEFDKWMMTKERQWERSEGVGPPTTVDQGKLPEAFLVRQQATPSDQDSQPAPDRNSSPTVPVSKLPLMLPRQADGDGDVQVTGERRVWHKITLTLDGPYAHEQDNQPNPFTDHRMTVLFEHPDGTKYRIPGYFAADGNAANSGAQDGNKWRAHFAPDRSGLWKYRIEFKTGKHAAINPDEAAESVAKFDGKSGQFNVMASDKRGRDLRAHGRLQYVGQRYLQHAGSGRFFLKAGADAPETLLGYADFDNTVAGKPNKVPLKTWQPHVQDWRSGDPTWKDGKGKGLIGAINYLSGKGCNAFSFLTYNAGGDGDNVWPFIDRRDKLHYDCSKLDQWGIVFDHGNAKGMYLHFKMQETENDDHNRGKSSNYVPECLDGGNLGTQRKLYCRELVARFGHNLALNWNLGEENTQTTAQQIAMINYIAKLDAYHHHIVVHTYPDQQDRVYRPLLGQRSGLTGVSLQNSGIKDTHWQTVKWIKQSDAAGRPWVVAFDESGSAAHAQCPDLGYKGFDGRDNTGKMIYDEHAVRRQTLWGNLMGGGAGVEYYFGYQFVENDLVCEDWRSRDRSWDYCRIALEFFNDNNLPFELTQPADELVGNPKHDNSKYCLARHGELYLVYLPYGGQCQLDLSDTQGEFTTTWFNPRDGSKILGGPGEVVSAGGQVKVAAPEGDKEDWLVMLRRAQTR